MGEEEELALGEDGDDFLYFAGLPIGASHVTSYSTLRWDALQVKPTASNLRYVTC